MEWWVAITPVAIPSQPALLMSQYVSTVRPSVLPPRAPRAILHSRHPVDYILPIFNRVSWLAVGVIPATLISKRLLCPMKFVSPVLRYFSSTNFPVSCLSMIRGMKSATHVPWKGCWIPPLSFPPWYMTFWLCLHPSMYIVIEMLPYSGHSLHWLVVFVCWLVSMLLSHNPDSCAPPLLLILV